MELKNYQEDVVLRAIEIALEDQHELRSDRDFVNDVAAYVLNRVPPRYVMSERGFLRLAMEHLDNDGPGESLANVIELMMLVNQGVEIVQGRRSPEAAVAPKPNGSGELGPAAGAEYVHNYPQIIGRVVERESGDPVYGATVTMHLDGDLAPPAAGGWPNPYITREETRGHFSFWPHCTRSESSRLAGQLLFTVAHPRYEPFRHVEQIVTEGSFAATSTIHGDRILSLPTFTVRRNGSMPGRTV